LKTPFTFYILPFPAPPPLSLLRERGEGRIGVFIRGVKERVPQARISPGRPSPLSLSEEREEG